LIGSELLNAITQNNNYNKIKLFVRSAQNSNDPKVEVIQIDFNNLEKHKDWSQLKRYARIKPNDLLEKINNVVNLKAEDLVHKLN